MAPGVGLLTMPTWALYDSKFAWEPYVDELFGELNASGTGDLVIDLRANEGGLGVGDRILAHLTTRDLPSRTARAQDTLSEGARRPAPHAGNLG